ncbi:MAG: response regulator [Oceanicaulis sp.]
MPGRAASLVLLVEDCPNDGYLLRKSLERFRTTLTIHQVRSLADARAALSSGQGGEPALRPACIIVDLDLPDGDGRTLIDWLYERDPAQSVPVIVLSGAPGRVESALSRRRASVVLEKPKTLDGYRRLSDVLGRLLLTAAGAPPADENHGADAR